MSASFLLSHVVRSQIIDYFQIADRRPCAATVESTNLTLLVPSKGAPCKETTEQEHLCTRLDLVLDLELVFLEALRNVTPFSEHCQ